MLVQTLRCIGQRLDTDATPAGEDDVKRIKPLDQPRWFVAAAIFGASTLTKRPS